MKNRVFYRPTLYDLSQGSRIKFIRYFRGLTQDNISDDLGITGENKRRTLTRYERNDRKPSKPRLKEIANILLINESIIKEYEFKSIEDIFYFLLWLEELFPKMKIDLCVNDYSINSFFYEWNFMRERKQKQKIFLYGKSLKIILKSISTSHLMRKMTMTI